GVDDLRGLRDEPAVEGAEIARGAEQATHDAGLTAPAAQAEGDRLLVAAVRRQRGFARDDQRSRAREPAAAPPAVRAKLGERPQDRDARAEHLGLVEEDAEVSISGARHGRFRDAALLSSYCGHGPARVHRATANSRRGIWGARDERVERPHNHVVLLARGGG